jgi:hypothetical protein
MKQKLCFAGDICHRRTFPYEGTKIYVNRKESPSYALIKLFHRNQLRIISVRLCNRPYRYKTIFILNFPISPMESSSQSHTHTHTHIYIYVTSLCVTNICALPTWPPLDSDGGNFPLCLINQVLNYEDLWLIRGTASPSLNSKLSGYLHPRAALLLVQDTPVTAVLAPYPVRMLWSREQTLASVRNELRPCIAQRSLCRLSVDVKHHKVIPAHMREA